MRILLVKAHPELLVAKRLQKGFLHLEPLELEIVAGGISPQDEVQILDLSVIEHLHQRRFLNKLKKFNPEILGFTAYSSNVFVVKQLAGLAKQFNKDLLVIVGGIHASLLPNDFVDSHIDLIVRGDGSTVIAEIVARLKNKQPLFFGDRVLSKDDPDFQEKIKTVPPYVAVEKIALPRRDLVDRSRYFCVWTSAEHQKVKTIFPQVASLRTSIGCTFHCSFCAIHYLMNRKYLKRTPEEVVHEIEHIKENHIYFVDDEMFLDAERARQIALLLRQRNIQKRYTSWARCDTIIRNKDLFKLWKEVGLDLLYVGLESMNDAILKEYEKKSSKDANLEAIGILKELGIILHAALIVRPDFEEQDFKNLEQDIADITRIHPAEITFTVLSPSPGTPYFNENKDSFICDPYRFYDCMHTILPTKLPLKEYYRQFARLNTLAFRCHPSSNKFNAPIKDFFRIIINGIRYIHSLRVMYKDY